MANAVILSLNPMTPELLSQAADFLRNAKRGVAFTGAGISVESGIPPFRGPTGLWSRVDPSILDIGVFNANPAVSWVTIKEIFYDFFGKARPNAAHHAIANLQHCGVLKNIITQNIDNLHQEAGSPDDSVIEYHGTSHRLTCMGCGANVTVSPSLFDEVPPSCSSCGGVLKPDFVFFGEPIPAEAQSRSLYEATHADVWLIVGTTGEIYPASDVPRIAKARGAKLVEVNIEPSRFTPSVDVFLEGKATEVLSSLANQLSCPVE